MQVAECLVPSCDTRRAEKLRRPKEAGSGCLSWSPGPHQEATAHRQGPVFPFLKRGVLVGGRAGIGTRGAISQPQELHLRAERNLKTAMMAEEVAVGGWGEHYLEPSSFDAPVELVVFSAPAPEAVGHPVALMQRQECHLPDPPRDALWSST